MVERDFVKSFASSSLIILVSVSGAVQADFISDSKATLPMRNLYFNNGNRQTKQVKQEEWGQGFLLKYQSGLTDGTVGFGADAIGALGIKLDSGQGRHNGSSFFPSDGDKAVDEFSALGLEVELDQASLGAISAACSIRPC
ncbi:hypothetical protein CR511_13720 [Pseudomonas putida]|nr:hypothetical protein CR511_13720 [Pseudomonas putida]